MLESVAKMRKIYQKTTLEIQGNVVVAYGLNVSDRRYMDGGF